MRNTSSPTQGTPTVFAVDEQTDHPVDLPALARLAETVLDAEGVRGDSELALSFVDEPTIAELNERYLAADGPTDVLAFPMDAGEVTEGGRSPDAGSTGPDRPDAAPAELPVLLGDVLVCPAVAARNVTERAERLAAGGAPDPEDTPNGTTVLADELALLVVHGTLHVLGMDHADPEQAAAMQVRERALLDRFAHPAG